MKSLLPWEPKTHAGSDRAGGASAAPESDSASAEQLGARHERLTRSLQQIGGLVEQLGRLSPIMASLEQGLAEELPAHRRSHADAVSAKALLSTTAARLEEAGVRVRALETHLEAALGEAEAARRGEERQRELASAAAAEADQARAQSAALAAAKEAADAALQASQARGGQLASDLEALQARLSEADAFRGSASVLFARARREALLLEEESVTLRVRLDEAEARLGQLTRREEDLQAALRWERERATPLQRALDEAAAGAAELRAGGEALRAEIAALATQLQMAAARAERLESLNGELSERLAFKDNQHENAERRLAEVLVSIERASGRAAALEEELTRRREAGARLAETHASAVRQLLEREELIKALDLTVRQAEERLREMQNRLDRQAQDHEDARCRSERAELDLKTEVVRLQAEFEVSRAELHAARAARFDEVSGETCGDGAAPRNPADPLWRSASAA